MRAIDGERKSERCVVCANLGRTSARDITIGDLERIDSERAMSVCVADVHEVFAQTERWPDVACCTSS